jgi:hypothetical protein
MKSEFYRAVRAVQGAGAVLIPKHDNKQEAKKERSDIDFQGS